MDTFKNLPLALFGTLSPAELARYEKQLLLPAWGQAAQERLKHSRVFVAGGSNLVATAALILVTAGVGYLRVVDQERVSLNHLGDQTIYRERDLNKPKALILQQRLRESNPFVQVEGLERKLSEHNAKKLIEGYDLLLVDLGDWSHARALNRAALKSQTPLILGWVRNLQGRLLTLRPGQGPCLACTTLEERLPATRALLAPLNAILAGIMALEALRLLGRSEPLLLARLFTFDGDSYCGDTEPVPLRPVCRVCGRTNQVGAPS